MTSPRALALALVLAAGCANRHPYVWVSSLPAQDRAIEQNPLLPGDQIVVAVPRSPEISALTEPITVNADGTIVLPLVGLLRVQGLTPAQAAQQVNARLNGIVINPDAHISVVNPRAPRVTVLGEVRTPGVPEGMRHGDGVLAALAAAGGLTEFADPNDIYVIRKEPKQQRIRFRYSELTGGDSRSVNFQLRDGDVVVVE